MTLCALKQICEKHNIPDDVTLMSDSGWECDSTHMDGVYYNEKDNVIVFTQYPTSYDYYFKEPDWKLLYGEFPSWDRGGKVE